MNEANDDENVIEGGVRVVGVTLLSAAIIIE